MLVVNKKWYCLYYSNDQTVMPYLDLEKSSAYFAFLNFQILFVILCSPCSFNVIIKSRYSKETDSVFSVHFVHVFSSHILSS